MKPIIFALLLSTMLICACRRTGGVSETESAAIRSDIQLVLTAMSDSLRTNGLTGWIPFLRNSTGFKWAFHGTPLSYDTLVAQIRREAPQYRSLALRWDSVRVEPLGEDETLCFAKYTETVVETTGTKSTITGTVKSRLERVSGIWQFNSGQTFVDAKANIE